YYNLSHHPSVPLKYEEVRATPATAPPSDMIYQSPRDIFINQFKYALDILKKHGIDKCDSIGTPMATSPKLDADLSADMFTKALLKERFENLVGRLSMRCLTLDELEVLANEPD
ncbi:hypothetical protein Tco_0899204, partial [Tanacetum coccineum]